MANSYFEFKKFKVFHDQCAMKIGTDGVLLGAWTCFGQTRTILDIGTGSGLIALMAAQRTENAQIWGIDIDSEATEQAKANADRTPWHKRLHFICKDIRSFEPENPGRFECIVCNPPFYQHALSSPDTKRNTARNTSVLPFSELISTVIRLLDKNGRFSVILPTSVSDEFMQLCWESGLNLSRKTLVYTKEGKSPKRILLEFSESKPHVYPSTSHLIMKKSDDSPTKEYRELTEDFYIK